MQNLRLLNAKWETAFGLRSGWMQGRETTEQKLPIEVYLAFKGLRIANKLLAYTLLSVCSDGVQRVFTFV